MEWLEYIFFFWEDPPGSGMSDKLFFTKIYFWIFLLIVLAIQSLIEEGNKWYTAALFSTTTAVLGMLFFTWEQLGPVFICWSVFAYFIIYYSMRNYRTVSRNAFLFAASLFFYYKTSGFFFLILVFTTLLNYAIGIGIHRSNQRGNKKAILALGIAVNLLVLSYFKYAYFLTDSYNLFVSAFNEFWDTNIGQYLQVRNVLAAWANEQFGGTFRVDKILLPVGISFYTFQTISYVVDVYRKEAQPVHNILDFGFYVSFFPQLVAGPIVRAKHFVPQLQKLHQITRQEFGLGIFWILNGLLKKAFLADFLANGFIDGVFDDPLRFTGFENLMGIIGYTMQVYADFSGYTDIAIGIALLMGFRLNTNFNSPYKALHVGDFWKRWHISLSSWLKDYLYIPLGGNRSGTAGTYLCIGGIIVIMIALSGRLWIEVGVVLLLATMVAVVISRISPGFKTLVNTNTNIMITMLLGGLWHGASWNFVVWGGLNGLGVVFYKFWRSVSPWEKSNHLAARAWKILVTLSFITFTRIFFRSPDMETAHQMISQITTQFRASVIPQALSAYSVYYIVLTAGFIIHWLGSDFKEQYRGYFAQLHWSVQVLISAIVVYVAHQSLQASHPFIYFQF